MCHYRAPYSSSAQSSFQHGYLHVLITLNRPTWGNILNIVFYSNSLYFKDLFAHSFHPQFSTLPFVSYSKWLFRRLDFPPQRPLQWNSATTRGGSASAADSSHSPKHIHTSWIQVWKVNASGTWLPLYLSVYLSIHGIYRVLKLNNSIQICVSVVEHGEPYNTTYRYRRHA